MFRAHTTTKGANGKSDSIRVAVPASEASAFIKKYGLTPDYDQIRNSRTKPLRGHNAPLAPLDRNRGSLRGRRSGVVRVIELLSYYISSLMVASRVSRPMLNAEMSE